MGAVADGSSDFPSGTPVRDVRHDVRCDSHTSSSCYELCDVTHRGDEGDVTGFLPVDGVSGVVRSERGFLGKIFQGVTANRVTRHSCRLRWKPRVGSDSSGGIGPLSRHPEHLYKCLQVTGWCVELTRICVLAEMDL